MHWVLLQTFFQSPLLSYPKSGVFGWSVLEKPKKTGKIKNGSTLKKKQQHQTLVQKKVGGKRKEWQSNKPAISRKNAKYRTSSA